MELVKVIKTTAVIKGLNKLVLISIEVESEDASFEYWNQADIDQTQKDLDKGSIRCLWLKVTARFEGLEHFEGVDTLGQVFVRSSMQEKDVLQSVNDHGMTQNATFALIQNVLKGKDQIDTFLRKAA